MTTNKNSELHYCGVLLAGGLSRRYGSPKAFAKKDGQFFYKITHRLLQSICDQVIIVAREEHLHFYSHEELVTVDAHHVRGHGPLAGIYSAMKEIHAKKYVVLPCDMPNMKEEVILTLIEKAKESEVTAFEVNGKKHPLVSVWPKGMIEPIEYALKHEKRRVIDVLNEVNTTWIDGSSLIKNAEHVFQNINVQV